MGIRGSLFKAESKHTMQVSASHEVIPGYKKNLFLAPHS